MSNASATTDPASADIGPAASACPAAPAAERWRLGHRLLFCAASAICCWMIFVRLGEMLVA